MGRRIDQRIYTCSICGEDAKDGDKLWHMGTEIWCEKCCKKVEEAEEAEETDAETINE